MFVIKYFVVFIIFKAALKFVIKCFMWYGYKRKVYLCFTRWVETIAFKETV